ncbi:Uncharacterised protein [Brucella melitensis]|nr:Uncharacterised protein [Brucella melitensis]
MVRKYDTLARVCQNHRMVANDGTAAQRGKADGAGFARASIAITHAHAVIRQRNVASARCRFTKQQRRAGWRINLVPVVHFQNFYVEIFRPKSLCRLLHEHGEEIDAEAHIAGLDDGGVAGGGADFLIILCRTASGADHMNDAGLRRKPGKFHTCGRAGEIKDTVRLGEDWQRIVGNRHAKRADAGHFASILAEKRGTGTLDCTNQFGAFDRLDGADERLAHAAARANHNQAHFAVAALHFPAHLASPVCSASSDCSVMMSSLPRCN